MSRSTTGGTYTGTTGRGRSYTGTWDYGPRRPHSRRATLDRLDRVATLLDTALMIPGTRIRFGADAVIGLVPGIGDTITTALSCWIVYQAYQLGAPRELILRMIGNVALDGVVGAVPLLGDAFDVLWRANRRNMRLLRDWADREGIA